MKAFTIKPTARIVVYSKPVSMVLGFPGLSELVRREKQKLLDGDLFVFVNEKRNYLKILFHAKDGLCMFSKQIEGGRFDVLDKKNLTMAELTQLVDHVIRFGRKKLRHLKAA